jgi:ankyrin repeat protein
MIATNPQQTVTALDGEDYRPLHWAATFGKIDIMRLLIDAGADVNAPNLRSAWTPLHDAAWHGHPDAIDVLIQHGARLDPLTGDGNMAIHWAAHAGQTKCITYLLMYGADIDSRNLDGNTPLAVAAWYGQLDTCKLLIAAGADIHSKNLAGSTPIDEAVRSGKNDVAELMKRYDSEMQLEAARQERLKANPLSIRTSYANWLDQKAVTKSVYHQDFAKDEIGSEWSTTPLPGEAHAPLRVSSTPRGHRRFLGDLGSQAVHLNIRGLPAHHEIAVTFDLFILNSWDGNDFRVGPDIWSFSLEDGPTLLNTTFANMGDGRRAVYLADQLKNFRVQSYPDEYPGGHNPLYSGADEVNTLGYMFNIDGVAVAMDAVYKMRYTFRNTDTDITLNFAAHGLQALDDESWGITNVEVSVDSAPVAATKPIPTSAHPTTIIATKPKPTTSRSAVVRKPTRKVTATKRKPTANKSTTKKTSTANSPHDKKKPLTP